MVRPDLYARDCRDCWLHIYHEEGEDSGKPIMHRGKKMERKNKAPPPCTTPKGCEKGTFLEPKTLTPANELAYEHYLECKATGRFPDDPVVARNAAAIERAMEIVRLKRQMVFEALIMQALFRK